MKYIQNLHHHRQPLRLKDYDYSQAGMYFITICTQNHECLFGEIADGKMQLNDVGNMIEKWFFELTNKFPDIECDEHIVMPNHVHFIIYKIDISTTWPNNGIIFDTTKRADTVGADLCVRPIENKNNEISNDKNNSVTVGSGTCGNKMNGNKTDENTTNMKKMNEYRMGVNTSGHIGPPNPCSHINFEPNKNRADTQVCPYNNGNEKINDEKKLMDMNRMGVDTGRHIGPPLRKIKKNNEQIMENEKNGEYTTDSSIPKIVQWFKTMTTNEYIRHIKQNNWKPFNGRLWQRNYYEHIIRNEIELYQIREYIINNPLKWKFDKEYL